MTETRGRDAGGVAAKELCELILDSAIEGFWDWDVRADRAFLSPRFCEMIGYSATDTEFNSSFFLSVIHPDDAPEVAAIVGEYLEGGTGRCWSTA